MTNLVMVMPYRAFLKKAKQEGFRVSAIWDPSLSSVMPGSPREFPAYLDELAQIADEFQLTDFSDEPAYADVIRRTAKEFGAAHVYHVGQEASMPTAYRVAEELGMAVNPLRAIELLNDKHAMRKLLADNGVSSVRFAHADRWQDVPELLADFELPVVVKPTELAGSRGVFLLKDAADVAQWGARLAEYDYAGPVLVEEYLRGPEFSVETISSGGEHHVIGVTRKSVGGPPTFVETGHVHPAADSPEIREIGALAVELLRLTGYRSGPAHTEVIYTEHGPKLVESQARLGGDRIPVLVELATGFDIERAIFRALAGKPLLPKTRDEVARVAYLSYPTGVLESVTGLDEVRALDFVAELSFPFEPGDRIPETVDSKTRHGHVIVHGATEEETAAQVARVRDLISVTVTDEITTQRWETAA